MGAVTIAFFFALPPVLRAIPSRYVVMLPEPIQQLGQREHVEQLPTAAVDPAAISAIFATAAPTETEGPTITVPVVAPRATPSAVPTGQAAESESTAQGSERPTLPPTYTPEATPTQTPTATPIPYSVEARLNGITHHFQGWNNCGPATLAMGLSYYDIFYKQSQTAEWLKPNPEDRNVSPHELVAFVNEETNLQAIDRVNGNMTLLKQLIDAGYPVIIETGIDPPGEYSWMEWYGHYYLVVAYDDAAETFWVYDSWLGNGENEDGERINTEEGRAIPYADFDAHWRQFIRHYIAIYEAEREEELLNFIGSANLDDQIMWEQALVQNRIELEVEQENPYLWFNTGTIYNHLGEYELAAAAYDQARALGLPWRMLWYQFGPYEAYMQVGRYDDVIELADVTLKNRPYFEESYYYRGLAYTALGETAKARRDLQSSINFNPRYFPAAEALAKVEG